MAKFEALKLATENPDSKPVLFGILVKCYMYHSEEFSGIKPPKIIS